MSYAIVEVGGQQIRVEPGRFYDLNYLGVDPDSSYSIDKVLLVNDEEEVRVGQPFVEGAIVEGRILEHRRGRKIIVYKMRPKKKTRKKRGHRQELSRLMISAIRINDKVIGGNSKDTSEAKTEATSPL
ncbi:50S ribosomal protein L21 [Cyanobacterium sp. uoEpiScrs1]|uniref:50S ribosomal protein L21 n=1 Tax=Cyanobacterium sp. uoEpiScrs1 TaxID=2976343 RepID=UPI002269F0EE|nr:50S ribosomal protein L21 [Cyanobacterium sp. uoEpiScrs1]